MAVFKDATVPFKASLPAPFKALPKTLPNFLSLDEDESASRPTSLNSRSFPSNERLAAFNADSSWSICLVSCRISLFKSCVSSASLPFST